MRTSPPRSARDTMSHVKKVSIRELHENTGGWVRKAVRAGAITITDRGKPVARITAIDADSRPNPFAARTLRPGFARLAGKLGGGRDSTRLVSDDREGR